jgi:uncharacterized protein (DUF1330 family)
MKTAYMLALTLFVGAGLGGYAVEVLHAQAKPPTYMIAVNEVTDAAGYAKDYLPLAQKTLKEHGARYIAAGQGTLIDGAFPTGRVVILAWDSLDQLKAWRNSPEYVAARKIGEKYAKYNIVAVEGVPQK